MTNAYRYRDWLIDAFNNDIPYDHFVRLQLAGDLTEPDDPDSHLALGFLGLGPKYYRHSLIRQSLVIYLGATLWLCSV